MANLLGHERKRLSSVLAHGTPGAARGCATPFEVSVMPPRCRARDLRKWRRLHGPRRKRQQKFQVAEGFRKQAVLEPALMPTLCNASRKSATVRRPAICFVVAGRLAEAEDHADGNDA